MHSNVPSPSVPEPMIRLDHVSKRYPNQPRLSVDDVSLTIERGEIVVFVGPSGCGKTTTMKMINRLITPTSGRIIVDGQDVSLVKEATLRRGLGYVIQQVGLFPHMTIADNIAMVPRMLGWDKGRTNARIDELLELVGLNSATFRQRYPRQLSGGQQQRIGVARALAADPPILLMDEPFGAVDPITRTRLQNELLRLQDSIQKTIVFVTHDIDEAIKLGNRIAIFSGESTVEQYDTPERILSQPTTFVREFVGAGSSVKRLHVIPLNRVALAAVPTSTEGQPQAQPGVVLDDRGHALRWSVDGAAVDVLPAEASMHDALDSILASGGRPTVVTDTSGRYIGTVGLAQVLAAMQSSGQAGTLQLAANPAESK